MNVHVLPVHKRYIKYSAILLALDDSSVIKDRKIRSVSFLEMKMNIVILIASINLFPDTGLYFLLFILPNQVAKALFCASEEFIHSFISSHMKELVICIKEFIIVFVCFVYDKCTWKVFRDIFECAAQLFADA